MFPSIGPSLGRTSNDPNAGSASVVLAHRRARVDSTNASTNRRRSGRLRSLPSMPLDILFEVFSHLSPLDLHRLARATKSFRRLLMSRQLRFIWTNALSQEIDTPPCPQDITEPAWVWLMFGERICDTCDARAKVTRIFEIRRRLCVTCLKLLLVDYGDDVVSTVTSMMGISTFELASYIPNIRSRGTTWCIYGWWKKDVQGVIHELQELRLQCVSDGEWLQALSDFKTSKQSISKLRVVHAKTCRDWVENCQKLRREELKNLKMTRKQMMCDRLAELGHHPSDLKAISERSEFKTSKPLTEKAWLLLLPALTAALNSTRDHRLELERSCRRSSRVSTVSDIYMAFRKRLPQKLVSLLPTCAEISMLRPLAEVIEEDIEVTPAFRATVLSLIFKAYPVIDAWIRRRIYALLLSIPGDQVMPSHNPSASSLAQPSQEIVRIPWPLSLDRLDLAMNVATCNRCIQSNRPLLFGLEQLAHRCPGEDNWSIPNVRHARYFSQLVGKLIALFAMDMRFITCKFMDGMGCHFVCVECEHGKICHWSSCIMTWRELIRHRARNHSPDLRLLDGPCSGSQWIARKINEEAYRRMHPGMNIQSHLEQAARRNIYGVRVHSVGVVEVNAPA